MKNGDRLIKTWRGPDRGSRLCNITSLPSPFLSLRYCFVVPSHYRHRAIASSLHVIAVLLHCQHIFASSHYKKANINSTMMQLWTTWPYVECIINSFLSKLVLLLPERFLYKHLHIFPVSENCYSFYFFFFCNNCM